MTAPVQERLVVLTGRASDGPEATVYIKGFLSRDEDPHHFEAWLGQHRAVCERLGWERNALGYGWESGQFGGVPVPLFASAKTLWDAWRAIQGVRRLALGPALGWLAAEQLARIAASFAVQYKTAARLAASRADQLAAELRTLARRHDRIRVVAHSLGCLHTIEAASSLPAGERPDEIHLCAPACREEAVTTKLSALARGQTFLYFTPKDAVLETAFRAMSFGRALGASGPARAHPGLCAVDVSEHFGFWVHNEYEKRFGRFAGEEPP